MATDATDGHTQATNGTLDTVLKDFPTLWPQSKFNKLNINPQSEIDRLVLGMYHFQTESKTT